MSYIILVNDDDSLYGSHKERIMQRQKLVNELIFLVNPIYRKTHDMTNASVLLEYVLPISRKYETVYLELCDERYDGCFLQYKLPFDTNLTSEHGTVELQLTFAYVEMDENGKSVQRVRKTSATTIEIIPISAWSDIIPDSALSGLDQRLIVLNSQMQALDDYMNVLDNEKADDIKYNEETNELQLLANGNEIGNKVTIKSNECDCEDLEDGVPVVDFGSISGGNTPSEDDEIEEDNVIEF